MAIKASGSISFSDITNEFGLTSLGAYRIRQNVGSLSDLPLDVGIPQYSQQEIKFSNFYSKRLNVVVDYYSDSSAIVRTNIRNRYNDGIVNIIGGFKSTSQLPSGGSGSRVIANVNNKLIGSEKGNRNYCAIRTGTWSSDANLEIVIGPSGVISGAGGDGGSGNSGTGGQGTSAIGVEYPVRIDNQGTIFGGRGGGGGGGIGHGYKHADTQKGCQGYQDCMRVGGGGGAGGRGYPGGSGGQAGSNPGSCISPQSNPSGGSNGSAASNGSPGSGGTVGSFTCASGAAGGGGGGAGDAGGGGSNGGPGGGGPGQRGYAIIISSSGSLISYTGGGGFDGENVNGSVV